jgi:hypothetical protein
MAGYQQGQPITIYDTFTVDGIETDPTTVTYTIQGPDGTDTIYTFPGDPEVTNPSVGNYELALGAPSLPGFYQYDVDAAGTVVASRAASFTVFPNVTSSPDLDWAVVGPCTPWADSQDVWSCCGQPMTTIGEGSSETECAVDMTQFAMEASQLLYELSGRLFSGSCERTVRPCSTMDSCGFQVLSRGHIVGWNGNQWGEDYRACGCRALDRILLSGYPVREITEVKIDGDVVDSATYRLDERRWLTRVRDPAEPDVILQWPGCQQLDLDDDQDGTFSVTYRYGQDPPMLGVAAAAQLGCELYRACAGGTGGECALPTGTTRINRQGIVIERLAFSTWAFRENRWSTGLPLVDAFLSGYNSTGNKRRPSVWSPSTRMRFARPVGN